MARHWLKQLPHRAALTVLLAMVAVGCVALNDKVFDVSAEGEVLASVRLGEETLQTSYVTIDLSNAQAVDEAIFVDARCDADGQAVATVMRSGRSAEGSLPGNLREYEGRSIRLMSSGVEVACANIPVSWSPSAS